MFPSEMVILLSIALIGDSGRTLVNYPMDVMNEYISYLKPKMRNYSGENR